MLNKLQYLSWVLSVLSVCFAVSAKAESQQSSLNHKPNNVSIITHLNEFPKITTVKELLSQSATPSQSSSLVTGVRINQTQGGIEVILDSKEAEKLQPTSRSEGNSFIIDIPNAQLRLENENIFRQSKAIAGISVVEVINTQTNGIRLTVTGEAALPKVELFDSDEGLIFSVTPATTATQPPETPEPEKPTSENPSERPSADNQEPIELLVTGEQDGYRVPEASTATKTDTPLRDIPQAIQVIPRQVLQDQQVRRLNDALRNAPGVTPDNSERSAFEGFTIHWYKAYLQFRSSRF